MVPDQLATEAFRCWLNAFRLRRALGLYLFQFELGNARLVAQEDPTYGSGHAQQPGLEALDRRHQNYDELMEQHRG